MCLGVIGLGSCSRDSAPAPGSGAPATAPNDAELAALPREVAALIQELRSAAAAAPTDARAQGKLGYAYEASHLWPAAQAAFARAAELAPKEALWRLHLAIALENLDRDDEALALLEALAAEFPKLAPVQQRLGVAYSRRNDLARAETAFLATRELVPNQPHGYVGLAELALAKGEFQAALELLEKALALAPDYKLAHFLNGNALRGLGRLEEAERELGLGAHAETLFMRDPGMAEVDRYTVGPTRTLEKALKLLANGKAGEAVALLEAARKEHPEDQKLLVSLGVAYLRAGRVDDATRVLTDAAKNDPRDATVPYNLAACEVDRGRFAEALAQVDAALALAPDYAPSHVLRGHALWKLGRGDEAEASLRRALALDPANRMALSELGNVLATARKWREASEVYAGALARTPDDFEWTVGLAITQRELGETALAEAGFARAEQLAGNDPNRKLLVQRARETRQP